MRTSTRILWTILVIDFLLLLAESDPGKNVTTATPATSTPTTAAATATKPTDAQPKNVTAPPATVTLTDTGSTNAMTSYSESTTGKPVTTEPPTTKNITNETMSTNLTTIMPTDVNATTKGPTPTTPATIGSTTAMLPTKVTISTMPATTVAAATVPTPKNPTTTNPIPENSATTNPIPEKPTITIPADSTSASPTSSGPAPPHPTTPAPPSMVSTHRQPASDQTTPALGPKTPASTTAAAKQPASTQPGPNPTTEESLGSTQGPGLAESGISEPFNETITLEYMQNPRNQKDSIVQSCLMLLEKVGGRGTCSLAGEKKNGRYEFSSASVAVDSKVMQEIYDAISKTPEEPTPVPHTLIAILSSCGALVLILVIFALYCTYHHRSYRKNQQHLTEELQTVENGYHDNPTLEVMEVQPEMQEKKMALNGEFNDSWIVPFDNLAKEETADEEDTHL